ncbi:putative periplasmic or secreted lipoprotein [Desulfosporosinus acidiphilus SJ4]|uniref:Putative periplasmic or secreted lipoprotein n=1 Tax=Desulfosporosinus acidiphilus (strain DSM 22704 / JCM 16185 / SJ4) TaxID=646529 RepID=I4D814_DESAJ|nr:type II toxin-antitoxin system HicA family toxin [Desulfosporosinus acidiphilus]AFM41938.1 putative periplasmic or secreted lipoprotein [Desulfosporosinus acidiphilus SJ4]
MTPRQPRVSGKDVVAALRRAGFKELYIEGSHHYLERPDNKALVTVPVHSNKILKPKTLKSVLNQAGLTIEQLMELL